jgi:Beta-glucosidase-related glycosidases
MDLQTDSTPAKHRNVEKPQENNAASANLPVDELLGLFAGRDAWHFRGSPTLGYRDMQVADCGHGVTLVAPPYGSATCFPTSIGMAATWNRDLIEEVGQALGRETRAKGCAMLLAPMVNLHRLPCGGRNYETFSEDPVLTGKMAAAIIRGLQSEGTAACIKSFACNNQQHDQKKTSSDVDPRTLRELYLKVFAIAFEESDPWSVMTSYNPINGAPVTVKK